ncbi:helix-turn-helix transcriptional regulator [Roseibaca sp. Y0-43]|uniref:helix-turn-helix transcriptional regulator n=1 Tax=Roseibaca sp. Y0-43 TaxID=2816854 RepID=UPI001D0CBD8F|nr:helix-turn-helix transcriptional regulator [Roseibaca sp. Y0-43]MCC1480096.1 helix-turn-helix transcriptional regulator [Roseibaca sp. Y0-43]
MIARDDSEFLLALAEAARGTQAWGAALALLRGQMQADRVVLYAEAQAWACTDTPPPDRPACFAALRPSRAYGAEEMADRAGPFDPDFTQGDSRVIAAAEPRLWLWLWRARGQFRAADSARLTSLMPHVAQALGLGQERARLAQALQTAQALHWRAGLGLVGPDGPDATAERLLDAGGVVTTAPGTLRALPDGVSAYGLPDGTVLLRAPRDLPDPETLAHALGLTLSEARLARAVAQGQSLAEASASLGLTRETGRSYAKQIYAKTGTTGQPALMRLIWCSALAFG